MICILPECSHDVHAAERRLRREPEFTRDASVPVPCTSLTTRQAPLEPKVQTDFEARRCDAECDHNALSPHMFINKKKSAPKWPNNLSPGECGIVLCRFFEMLHNTMTNSPGDRCLGQFGADLLRECGSVGSARHDT